MLSLDIAISIARNDFFISVLDIILLLRLNIYIPKLRVNLLISTITKIDVVSTASNGLTVVS